MSQPFRFVHSSDLHLERPLGGLGETPAHLADLLIDAPYAAAERVFDLAVSERADFLVLSGDVLDVDRAGPRAVAFLLAQCERLAAREIAVYWAYGAAERRSPWPAELRLPANVHVFARGAAQTLAHHSDGEDLAVLVGTSDELHTPEPHRTRKGRAGGDAPFETLVKPKGGRFALAVIHGRVSGKHLAKSGFDYWACGGEHGRRQFGNGRHLAVYPGAPQARSPAERGVHGAVVVDVDEHGAPHPRFVATDLARFRRVRLTLDATAPQSEQEKIVADRVRTELARAPGLDLFLRWQLSPTGGTTLRTPREAWGQSWLRWLRQEFGTDSPAAWTLSVEVQSPGAAAGMAVPDGSLLADYLTAIADFEQLEESLPLAMLLPESQRSSAAARLIHIDDAHERARVLRQARLLGRDLLGAEEESA
jgi:DNA repair protein SbcD/Mre11